MRGSVREQEPFVPERLPLKNVLLASAVMLPVFARIPLRHPAGGQAHTALPQELVACLVAAAIGVVVTCSKPTWPRPRDGIALLTGLLVVFEIVAACFAPNPWMALRASGLLVAGLTIFTIARAVGEPTSAPLFASAVVAGSVLLEAFGVLTGWSRTGHAPGGILGERNAAAEFLVCAMPYVVAMALREAPRWRTLFANLTLGLSVAAVIMARTRSAWLATGALAVLGFVLALRTTDDERRARAGSLVVAASTGLSLAIFAPQKLAWTSAHPYRETLERLVDTTTGSGAGRCVQYATTWAMALRHPFFGVGPGNWSGIYPSFAAPDDPTIRLGFSPTTRIPSSDVFGFLAERGLVASVVAVALLVALARGKDEHRWLRRGTILAMLVVGSLDAVLQLGPHLLLVAWILGTSSPPTKMVWRAPSFALAGGALVAAVLAACRLASFVVVVRSSSFDDLERAARLDRGDVALRLSLAKKWIDAGRCDRAEPHLRDTLRFDIRTPALESLLDRCPTGLSIRRPEHPIELRLAGYTELLVNVRDVTAHRRWRDVEAIADLAVRFPEPERFGDLALAVGELVGGDAPAHVNQAIGLRRVDAYHDAFADEPPAPFDGGLRDGFGHERTVPSWPFEPEDLREPRFGFEDEPRGARDGRHATMTPTETCQRTQLADARVAGRREHVGRHELVHHAFFLRERRI